MQKRSLHALSRPVWLTSSFPSLPPTRCPEIRGARAISAVVRTALIGIDLGTSNSTVACLEDGQAVVVPAADGRRSTPSVVSLCKVQPSPRLWYTRKVPFCDTQPGSLGRASAFASSARLSRPVTTDQMLVLMAEWCGSPCGRRCPGCSCGRPVGYISFCQKAARTQLHRSFWSLGQSTTQLASNSAWPGGAMVCCKVRVTSVSESSPLVSTRLGSPAYPHFHFRRCANATGRDLKYHTSRVPCPLEERSHFARSRA